MKKVMCVLALLALGALPAFADVVNVRPQALGVSADGISLKQALDAINTDHSSQIDTYADQSPSAIFTNQGTGTSAMLLVIEIAGNRNNNEFGIYKYGDPTNKVAVFPGAAGVGGSVAVNFLFDGSIAFNNDITNLKATNFGNVFGFYMNTGSVTYYSEDSLNPGGLAQALLFKGKGDQIQVNPWAPGSDANHYYVAFEDQPYDQGDHDFNDLAVLVESITPVPEPASMLLLGTGLFGLAGVVRRRMSK